MRRLRSEADWENQFIERTWTYSLDAVWGGLQACYATLVADVQRRYDVELISAGALGVSAMMHGYLAFASDGELRRRFEPGATPAPARPPNA